MSDKNEVVKAQKTDMSTVQSALQHPAISKRIEDMLGKRSPQFCSALIQVSKQKHLAECEPVTIIGSAMTAAAMDLSIDPNLGFAHIVPYNNSIKNPDGSWRKEKVAQFQMGYKGFIQLGLRTGQYAAMNDFKVNKDAFIAFNPVTGELTVDAEKLNPDSEDIVGYGFYFRLINGFEKTVYWPKERIEAHAKQFSKSFGSGYGPWKDNFHAMALKTVIKLALGKYGVLSTEMQFASTHDQAVISSLPDNEVIYIDNETSRIKTDKEKEEALKAKAFEAYAKKVVSKLLKMDLAIVTASFEDHGYFSEKSDSEEAIIDLACQTNSRAKLDNVILYIEKKIEEESK